MSVPCSLFPVPCSLFPVPCSLFPVPCSLFPVPWSPFPVPGSRSLFPIPDSRLDGESLDLARQSKVVRGDPTRVVRAQRERETRVPDVDVGVMIHRFGEIRDASNEADPRRERREPERLRERIASARPTGKRAKLALDADVGETFGH